MVAVTPNLGIISLRSTLVLCRASLLQVGKAAGRPEKGSVSTERYVYPLFWVIQSNQFATVVQGRCPSQLPLNWVY